MNFLIETNQAIEWTVRLVSVFLLTDTLEKFYNFREFKDKGVFSWELLRKYEGFVLKRPLVRGFADLFFGFRSWFCLLALRGSAALILIVLPRQGWVSTIGLLISFFVGSLANFRRMPFKPETPNRFTLIIIGALFLQSIFPSQTVTLACLWYIALQSCLSYATAGITKLFNKDWLTGNGIFKVVSLAPWLNSPKPALFFQRHQFTGKVLNYVTLAFECLFPLVLVVGKPFFVAFLIWGFLFHLTNAVLLRFNNFFWAWIATYPAIIFIAQEYGLR